jgi:hypothetical protein
MTLRENSSMGQGVRSQRQSATRLACKACFKGSVERNMEPKLGERHKNENVISKTWWNPLQCIFHDPREGKLSGFFMFIESKKNVREDSIGYLFRK